MKSVITAIFTASALISCGLTPYEASIYGSAILVCGPESRHVLYWTTSKQGAKDSAGQ